MKCLAVIKNTIELAIVGLIPKCDRITEYLDRIKQLVTESHSRNGGIRELTMRRRNYGTDVLAIFRGGE